MAPGLGEWGDSLHHRADRPGDGLLPWERLSAERKESCKVESQSLIILILLSANFPICEDGVENIYSALKTVCQEENSGRICGSGASRLIEINLVS